jgi:hypothetical protein
MRGSIMIDPRTLRHSPVGVSTAAAPLPEERQGEQPLHRSLHHLVTSASDWQVDVTLRPAGATPKTPHGPRRYQKALGVRALPIQGCPL